MMDDSRRDTMDEAAGDIAPADWTTWPSGYQSDRPGVAVPGHIGVRAGDFGGGRGALGITLVANPSAASDDDLPAGYTRDAQGRVQMTPDFARTHPKGPFDLGTMARNIDWSGVIADLGTIAGGAAASAAAADAAAAAGVDPSPRQIFGGLLGVGGATWNAQTDANKPGQKGGGAVDRATNGLP